MDSLTLVSGLVGIITLLVTYIYVVIPYKYRIADSLGGPKKHWLYGNLNIVGYFKSRGYSHLYGPIFRTWRGPFFADIVVTDADWARKILSTCPKDEHSYAYFKDYLGSCFFIKGYNSEGSKVKEMRKCVGEFLHKSSLDYQTEVSISLANRLVSMWSKRDEDTFDIDAQEVFSCLSMDSFTFSVFNADFNTLENGKESHPFTRNIDLIVDIIIDRMILKPWLGIEWIFDAVGGRKEMNELVNQNNEFVNKILQRRIKELQENPDSFSKFNGLDKFIQINQEIGSSEGAVNDTAGLLLAAIDTTATANAFFFSEIYKHQECLEKIVQEIDSVMGDRCVVEKEDCEKFEYLELCIKESLRFHPPVTGVFRYVDKDITVDGVTLPKGRSVVVNFSSIHFNEKYWENPYEFIPERHTYERSKDRNPFAFLAFNAGMRKCLGRRHAIVSMKITIATVLRNFKLKLLEEIQPALSITSTSKNGVKMKVDVRNPKEKPILVQQVSSYFSTQPPRKDLSC